MVARGRAHERARRMSNAIIGALRVSLGLDTAAFQDGIRNVNSTMKNVGAQLAKVGAGLSVASAGVGAGLKRGLDAADELGKTAQTIGIPIEALGRLGYAADLSGVSMEALQTGVGRLSRNMVDFAAGGKAAVAAFDAVGVSATDADGTLRPTEAVLADLATAFAAMPDGAEKTAAAMKLLGRGGAEMIPLLNGGAEALRALGAEAERMGVVISADTAKSAEIFNDNVTRLTATLGGLGAIITAQLAPTLAGISDTVVGLAGAFQGLSPNTQEMIGVAAGLTVVLGPLVVAAGLLLTAMAAISAPILLATAGIIAATAAAVAFWPEITAAKDAVVAFGTDALDWIKAKPAEIVEAFRSVVASMRQIGIDIIAGLWEGLTGRFEALKTGIAGIADGITEVFKNTWDQRSPSRVFAEIGSNVMLGLAQGLEGEQGSVRAGMATFAQGIAGEFKGILSGAVSFKEGLSNVLGNVGDSLLNSGLNGVLGGLQIPGFARGTNFAPGGLALVGERGPEVVDLPRGARVTPNHRMTGTVVNFNPTINAPGADSSGLAQVREQLRVMQETLPQTIQQAIADPRRR